MASSTRRHCICTLDSWRLSHNLCNGRRICSRLAGSCVLRRRSVPFWSWRCLSESWGMFFSVSCLSPCIEMIRSAQAYTLLGRTSKARLRVFFDGKCPMPLNGLSTFSSDCSPLSLIDNHTRSKSDAGFNLDGWKKSCWKTL